MPTPDNNFDVTFRPTTVHISFGVGINNMGVCPYVCLFTVLKEGFTVGDL